LLHRSRRGDAAAPTRPEDPLQKRFAVFLSLALGSASALAQEPAAAPQAPELARLGVFVGNWEGSGTALLHPGATARWTSQSSYQWALDGNFLRADTTIQFAGEASQLQFLEYLGWDREQKRYVTVTVDNMGEGRFGTLTIADDEVIGVKTSMRDGQPVVEREVSKLGKDSMSVVITLLTGAAPPVEMVNGTFKRLAQARPTALEAVHAMQPPGPPMRKLARAAGTYDIAGDFLMGPGMPPTKFTGREALATLFDGAILHVHTTGIAEGSAQHYEGHGFYAWDGETGSYRAMFLNNMGEAAASEARFVGDDKLVFVMAGMRGGVPFTERNVLSLDKDGKPLHLASSNCTGDAAPFQSFQEDYKPAK
jgi:Protein of unknown function (DUF1579)